MIRLKTRKEIEKIREGGKILVEILERIKKSVRPGITTLELNNLAERLIQESDGKPSFKMVSGYKWATCMCVNEVVVHGVPNDYKLKAGDILGIDIGLYYQGFHTDMAETVTVQDSSSKNNFLEAGRKALKEAIKMAKVGNRIGHISLAIEKIITQEGFSPVQKLVGHGIGRKLHEDPQIPCFLKGDIESTPLLKEGMVLAIEVIYNQKGPDVVYQNNDGWTIKTRDGSLSGLFEKTIAVLEEGPLILT